MDIKLKTLHNWLYKNGFKNEAFAVPIVKIAISWSEALAVFDKKTTKKIIKNYLWNKRNLEGEHTWPDDQGHEELDEDPASLLDVFRDKLKSLIPTDVMSERDEGASETEGKRALALLWLLRIARENEDKAKVLIDGNIPNNWNEVKGNLETFFVHQRFMSERDLNKIKTAEDLGRVVNEAKHSIAEYQESKEYMNAEEGIEVLSDNTEGWYVAAIKNKGAACQLGKSTSWCTASPGLNYFETYYSEDSPLFFFKNNKSGDRYQFQYTHGHFMDVNDHPVNKELASTLHGVLFNLLADSSKYPSVLTFILTKGRPKDVGPEHISKAYNNIKESPWDYNQAFNEISESKAHKAAYQNLYDSIDENKHYYHQSAEINLVHVKEYINSISSIAGINTISTEILNDITEESLIDREKFDFGSASLYRGSETMSIADMYNGVRESIAQNENVTPEILGKLIDYILDTAVKEKDSRQERARLGRWGRDRWGPPTPAEKLTNDFGQGFFTALDYAVSNKNISQDSIRKVLNMRGSFVGSAINDAFFGIASNESTSQDILNKFLEEDNETSIAAIGNKGLSRDNFERYVNNKTEKSNLNYEHMREKYESRVVHGEEVKRFSRSEKEILKYYSIMSNENLNKDILKNIIKNSNFKHFHAVITSLSYGTIFDPNAIGEVHITSPHANAAIDRLSAEAESNGYSEDIILRIINILEEIADEDHGTAAGIDEHGDTTFGSRMDRFVLGVASTPFVMKNADILDRLNKIYKRGDIKTGLASMSHEDIGGKSAIPKYNILINKITPEDSSEYKLALLRDKAGAIYENASKKLYDDPDAEVRSFIAGNKQTSEEIFYYYMLDHDPKVRMSLAENPLISPDMALDLANDRDKRVAKKSRLYSGSSTFNISMPSDVQNMFREQTA